MGTAISLERAVALRRVWCFVAPLCSALAGLLWLAGTPALAAGFGVLAATVFVLVSCAVLRRQPAAHTMLLLVGACAWLAGNLAWAAAADPGQVVSGWFCFVVLTVTAERLELTRMMRRPSWVQTLLLLPVALLLAGTAASGFDLRVGGVVFGAGLMLLAAWLARFDIARRTVRSEGLAAYMAWCLLAGYGWLALAGLAWLGTALGCPERDMALHALGLGFIISMVMGHAPVILPALTGVRVRFHPRFYVPLGLLHVSLCLRVLGPLWQPAWLTLGAVLNALALAAFALTLGSAIRRQ